MSNRRQGSALLTVLWLTAALAAIGLAVASNVRGETDRAATDIDDAKAYFMATGAIERARLHMNWGPDYYVPGNPVMEFSFPEGEARVEIIPETSRLNINAASLPVLGRLLMALGAPEDRAAAIAAAIIEWRTPAEGHTPYDIPDPSAPTFQPRHASFLQNEELLLVQGITPDLYYGTSLDGSRAGLKDCVSPSANAGGVDANTARAETMIAVGVPPEVAAEIVRDRPFTPQQFSALRSSLGPEAIPLFIGGNSMFTLRATARLRRPDGKLSDLRRTVAELIKIQDTGLVEVVRWYDRG